MMGRIREGERVGGKSIFAKIRRAVIARDFLCIYPQDFFFLNYARVF